MNKLHSLAKLLWITGGILCLMVFVFQATSLFTGFTLLNMFTPLMVFLIYLVLFIVVMSVVLVFFNLFYKLEDVRHLNKIKANQRRIIISAKINGEQISLEASDKENAKELLEQFQALHPTIEETAP